MTTEQAIKELKFAELENQMRKNSVEREKRTCPFCGEKDDIDYGIMSGTMKGFDYVQCQNCGAEINSVHNGEYIEAIEKWNRRVDDA